jgi:hypothetical protein
MKDPQLNFFGRLGRIISPDSSRTEPLLWFREVRLLRKLEAGETNEVRRITLRRGLNIVWAPPEEGEETQLYGDGLSGHASGKTLFCRILRFLLGEQFYGGRALRDAVDEKFKHELWAVAEVVLDGQLWLVARPLAGTSPRFATRGASLDELLGGSVERGNFTDFTDAIDDVICGPIAQAAEGDEQFRWRMLMPWLARDQECRFASVAEWRSTSADSDNPLTNVTAQHELIKATLGMLQAEEVRLRGVLAGAEATIKESLEQLPTQERTEQRDRRKLLDGLRRIGMTDLKGDEELKTLEARRLKHGEGLSMFLEHAEKDPKLVATKTAWENAVKARDDCDSKIEQAKTTLAQTTKKWEERTSRHQRLRANGIENPARLEQGFCPKSRSEAERSGCISKALGSSLETDVNLGEIQAEGDEFEQLKKQQERGLAELEGRKRGLSEAVTKAHTAHEIEKERIARETSQVREWSKQLSAVDVQFDTASESAASLTETRENLAAAQKQKAEVKEAVEKLREIHAGAEKRFSDAFADAVRAAMGGKVEPSASLTERGLTLSVKRKGELSGAALETIKVIAFDVAAMVLSMEGVGFHPRFLIHDGPREADMSRVIYERFFLYCRKLEECFVPGAAANFQYIITTTTAPPKGMREGSDWLRLRLNTAVTEERLLKEDL